MLIIDDKTLKKEPLTEGGEAYLYEYHDYILKVYRDNIDKKEKLKKLEQLLNLQLTENVIKPIHLAYNNKKEFIGFTMKKVKGEVFKSLTNKKFLKSRNILIKDIASMLIQIKNTLIAMHKNRVYMSDLNDLNILFDENYNVYFIDVDSYSIDNDKGTAYTETFLDPQLKGNDFTNDTDAYSFAVLAFKTFTRLHPFGGTTNPDMKLMERMQKGISVIDNPNVVIPTVITKWDFMSPKLIKQMKEIFNTNDRSMLDTHLEDFYKQLKLCNQHKDYYYGKFNQCPLCVANAKIIDSPVKTANVNNIPCILLFSDKRVQMMLSNNSFLDIDYNIVHINKQSKVKFEGNKVYFSDNADIIYTAYDKHIVVQHKQQKYTFDKMYKSDILVYDNVIYYVNLNHDVLQLTIDKYGNHIQNINKISLNAFYKVMDKNHYFICNVYPDTKIMNINGYNFNLKDNGKVINYGLHFDKKTKRWLVILEDSKGNYKTYIFEQNRIVFETDSIKYNCDLDNLCFDDGIIFKSGNKIIRGFSYEKNVYKDFQCDIINEDTKLTKDGARFIAINEKQVYKIG